MTKVPNPGTRAARVLGCCCEGTLFSRLPFTRFFRYWIEPMCRVHRMPAKLGADRALAFTHFPRVSLLIAETGVIRGATVEDVQEAHMMDSVRRLRAQLDNDDHEH